MAEQKPFLVIKPNISREPKDCAMVALSTYLSKSYEDVLRAVTEVDRRYKGKSGLYVTQMRRTAKELGYSLKTRKAVDFHEDYGILILDNHVVILRNGLVFDYDGSVWDVDDYLAHYGYTPEGLLYGDI